MKTIKKKKPLFTIICADPCPSPIISIIGLFKKFKDSIKSDKSK